VDFVTGSPKLCTKSMLVLDSSWSFVWLAELTIRFGTQIAKLRFQLAFVQTPEYRAVNNLRTTRI